MRILLVEDDLDMSAAISRALTRRGFHVTLCLDGHSAFNKMRDDDNDVIVLDLNIPGLDGLHLLHRARALDIRTPILVLTVRGSVGDRVSGLNAGADDYLGKPFDLEELEARLRALGRRGTEAAAQDTIQCGALRYDRRAGVVFGGDTPLLLGPREAAVLRALIDPPGHAVAKERLFREAYPLAGAGQPEFIEVVVHRLRKKLAPYGVQIMTLRGVGYLLRRQRQP